jgi:hypothetical protein
VTINPAAAGFAQAFKAQTSQTSQTSHTGRDERLLDTSTPKPGPKF